MTSTGICSRLAVTVAVASAGLAGCLGSDGGGDSGRSILAEIALDGEPVVVGSFHGTPGTGKVGGVKVHEWKPFFPGAVAAELAGIKSPFVFGIDANEPESETVDSKR